MNQTTSFSQKIKKENKERIKEETQKNVEEIKIILNKIKPDEPEKEENTSDRP